MLWVSAALAALLSLDRLFQADFEDGSLDVLALSPLSLEAASAAKILAHWITTGMPLVLLSPVLGLLLNLPPPAFGALVASAQADNLQGAPIQNGNQCFKYSTGADAKDGRFGSWGACPQAASTSTARATTRRTPRRSRTASH